MATQRQTRKKRKYKNTMKKNKKVPAKIKTNKKKWTKGH